MSVKGMLFRIGITILLLVQFSAATEIDRLVRELVKKGVIDPATAQELLTLTEQDVKKSLAMGEVETVPKWTQVISMKGDFRYRTQWEQKEDGDPRLRNRLRYRLGGQAQVSPGWQVGFGLATGGTDPRSTNATLENMFETKGIMLDYAYGTYIAPRYLTVTAGKFANKLALWKSSDLLWDSDISVEGISTQLAYRDIYLNSGYLILDEYKAQADPAMTYIQPGIAMTLHERYDIKGSLIAYSFNNLLGEMPDHSSKTNSFTIDTSGNPIGLKYKYKNLGFSGSFGINNLIFPYVGVYTELIKNIELDEDNTGYLFGLYFGAKKVAYRKDWQLKYCYRYLEKDAWLDFLPDSDTYGGATDIKGHELIFEYGLSKNVSASIDYYKISGILDSTKPQQLMQMDFNFKF
ncbi:MAG: putative porin [Candidatus Marinimicrobia bacterium]|nr:putative porin [Candidatus Neomarinimicrobiota bacterium]